MCLIHARLEKMKVMSLNAQYSKIGGIVMKCVLNDEVLCTRKAITKDYEERPQCLSISFESTASDCFEDKEVS